MIGRGNDREDILVFDEAQKAEENQTDGRTNWSTQHCIESQNQRIYQSMNLTSNCCTGVYSTEAKGKEVEYVGNKTVGNNMIENHRDLQYHQR